MRGNFGAAGSRCAEARANPRRLPGVRDVVDESFRYSEAIGSAIRIERMSVFTIEFGSHWAGSSDAVEGFSARVRRRATAPAHPAKSAAPGCTPAGPPYPTAASRLSGRRGWCSPLGCWPARGWWTSPRPSAGWAADGVDAEFPVAGTPDEGNPDAIAAEAIRQ
jgi:hypothetical protein